MEMSEAGRMIHSGEETMKVREGRETEWEGGRENVDVGRSR